MKVFKAILLFAGLMLFFGFNVGSTWQLRKNKEDIKVFTRDAKSTDVQEIKVTMTLNTTVEEITKAILDVKNYTNWMENIESPSILEKVSENEYYLYYELDAPWPADNRDIINHTTISYDATNNTTTINSKAAPDYIAKKDGIVRVTLSEGCWTLKQISPDKVELNHCLLASPGGSIPDWIINMFIVDHPYNTHQSLRALVEVK